MVTSKDNYLLDLPQYETTKGTTKDDQLKALMNKKSFYAE